MNTKFRYAVLAVLTIGILVALALSVSTPLLYTLENDIFQSRFHENVDILKEQQLNSTTDILPRIQEFIDYPGPISLNIRIHDIGQAQRDLERFRNSHGSVKNLIVRLDMSESEIQALEQNTALQQDILDSLLNTTISLDTLQSMEIQYSGENNNDMMTTVRLQGDELRKKVRGLDGRYRNATEQVMRIGTKLGLEISKTNESQFQVEQIVREIQQPKTITRPPVDTSLVNETARVSLFIRPDAGKYREVIEYMGLSLASRGNTTLRAEGKPITLYIDDLPSFTVVTDTFGYYNTRLPIEQIPAGTHTIYARSSTSRSVNRALTVILVDSVTNLSVSKPDTGGNVNCTGSVMANYPVRSASVQITWDQTHIIITKTDANGYFMREIKLPPGQHTLVAGFSGRGYPINSSESEPRVVDIPLIPDVIPGVETDSGQGMSVISVIGIILLFMGAAIFYLRRISRRKTLISGSNRDADFPAEAGSELRKTDSDLQAPSMKSGEETLIAYYTRILREQGLSAASWSIYQQLAGRMARDFRIKRHKSLTAREMSRNCRGKPYCGAFARFISIYERIRYGGQVSVKDQSVFETALQSTDEQMEGENH